MASIGRIGIVTGMERELAALLPDATWAHQGVGGFGVRSTTFAGKTIHAACAGIGKVAGATAAGVLHARFGVDLLMVVGTAGLLAPDRPELEGRVFLVTEAIQADYGAVHADGFVHYPAGTLPIGPARLRAFEAYDLPDAGLPTARIATGDSFVADAAHSRRLAETLGATLVDMETGAVAQAAALLGLPWAAVKGTTDAADEASAANFAANLDRAARAAADAAAAFIARL